VADETLIAITAAGVLRGVAAHTVLLINSSEKAENLQSRLALSGPVVSFPAVPQEEGQHGLHYVGVACAGAAARLTGVISRSMLETAINEELSHLGPDIVAKNLQLALHSYDLLAPHSGAVTPGCGISASDYRAPPGLICRSTRPGLGPAIFARQQRTGANRFWRMSAGSTWTCRRCSLCAIYCPENAIV
jgi:pyruvate ferredoxin oxidoreductase gamma subunit